MSERPMEEVMDALAEYLPDFDAVCRGAVATYQGDEYSDRVRLEHDRRAQASCIYSHMVEGAHRRFTDRAGIMPYNVNSLKVWLVGPSHDVAVVRFKKMDEDGRSRSYQTGQARDYDYGETLDGIPPAASRVTVGYLLDPPGSGVQRVQVARPRGKGIAWCAAIVPQEERVQNAQLWIDVTRQRQLG